MLSQLGIAGECVCYKADADQIHSVKTPKVLSTNDVLIKSN